MKPYYADELVTLYHGDCRELIDDVAATAVVTDPPYGIGVEYGHSTDTPAYVEQLVADLWPRLARFERVALTPGVGNIHRYPPPTWTLCWFDPGGVGSGPWGFCTWQPILVYGKDPYLSQGLGRRPDGLELMQRGDPDRELGHPCPKPVGVLRWLIQRTTLPTDVILDPFAGSGTTLRAAKDLGRRAIGIELEERFCEIAVRRVAQEALEVA